MVSERREHHCTEPDAVDQGSKDKEATEDPHGQSCTDSVAAAAPEQEGGRHCWATQGVSVCYQNCYIILDSVAAQLDLRLYQRRSVYIWRLKGCSRPRMSLCLVVASCPHVGLLRVVRTTSHLALGRENRRYRQSMFVGILRIAAALKVLACAGEDHAQDQSEVLAALEEALADDVPSKVLIVAADPGATGGSTKSSSTGSANISVIATADMIVRRPRNR